jgi:DNA-binding PadR family transcriptional regulator
MRSPIGWGVLGLLIERTGYGYDLVHRFERTYRDTIELSSPSQVYKALTALEDRGLIEKLPREQPAIDPLRQPKPHYRATAEGLRSYQDWLLVQVTQERQRSSLFAIQLAMLEPRAALALLDRCEQTYLQQQQTPAGDPSFGGASSLAHRLVAEVKRLEAGQTLKWTEYARRELQAAIAAQGEGEARGPAAGSQGQAGPRGQVTGPQGQPGSSQGQPGSRQ